MSSKCHPSLQRTCLKPKYSLRTQLFVSFGLTSAVAFIVVVAASVITASWSGEHIKHHYKDLFHEQVITNIQQLSSRYVTWAICKKFDSLRRAAILLRELTRDRVVGYPDENYQDDRHVPFEDFYTSRNIYPFVNEFLPPDWNITQNVNEENFREHTGTEERWRWYDGMNISTAHAAYQFQGNCDPSETDPNAFTYFENCTEENNNVMTGGVLQPTESNRYLAEKAANLGVFLKPMYEAQQDIERLGIGFANLGAGASVVYPPRHIDGTNMYESIGCDWMSTTNPFTTRPYASQDEISRCHKAGDQVKARTYNPLERGWCREQALGPNRVGFFGPYMDALSHGRWLLTAGTAVFDRLTDEFVGCTFLDVSIQQISGIFDSIAAGPSSKFALVRWRDGTVVASPEWNTSAATETIHVRELSFMDDNTFDFFKSLVDFESEWIPD